MMDALLLALLAAIGIANAQQCDSDSSTVLILGGGMAGVAAANRLNQLGITDFVLLEAQDRLGGRMRSEELVSGVNVNVGANWMHGVDPANLSLHPLYALALRCTVGGLNGFVSNSESLVVYDESGSAVMDGLRYSAYESARSQAYSARPNPDVSIRQGLSSGGWTPMDVNDRWVEWLNVDYSYAQSPDTVSLAGSFQTTTNEDFLASPSNTARDFLITDNRGSVFLVECLANEFANNNISGDPRIHLNTRVSLIERGDDCVCVTAQENGGTTQYCGRYAIVTFSTGVLKAQMNSLFSPPLPAAKINALSLLDNAFYYVIWVAFENRFWDTNFEAIGYISSARGYLPIILVDTNDPARSNYVHLHVAQNIALTLAQMTDDALLVAIGDVFRTIYGSSSPDPIAITSMRWGLNDLFLGSYTAIRPGGAGGPAEMARPEGRMYFAGEGTSERYTSTMHGAYFTGIAAANNVSGGGMQVVGNLSLVVLFALSMAMFSW